MSTGEKTTVTGSLTCGGEPMVNQEMFFTSNSLGSIQPARQATNESGEAAIEFTAGESEGTTVITGQYSAREKASEKTIADDANVTISTESNLQNWSGKLVLDANEFLGTHYFNGTLTITYTYEIINKNIHTTLDFVVSGRISNHATNELQLSFDLFNTGDRIYYYEAELQSSLEPGTSVSPYEKEDIIFSDWTGDLIYLQEGTQSGMNSYNLHYTQEYDDALPKDVM